MILLGSLCCASGFQNEIINRSQLLLLPSFRRRETMHGLINSYRNIVLGDVLCDSILRVIFDRSDGVATKSVLVVMVKVGRSDIYKERPHSPNLALKLFP